MTEQKVQDDASDKFRKHDKFTKKDKGTNITGKETLEVEDDETELQRTETTMVLMMREVLSVKVSVTNAHADVTARPVISRAWYTLQTLL